MNLILCGLPMSGKSTYGKLLAERLGWEYIDTDRLIEDRFKQQNGEQLSCRAILKRHGADYFRKLESLVLESLLESDESVIALGGGSLHSPSNRSLVKQLGKVAYLEASFELIQKRLQQQPDLPSYLDLKDPIGSLKRLVEERLVHYQEVADIQLDLSQLTNEEVLETLMEEIRNGQ